MYELYFGEGSIYYSYVQGFSNYFKSKSGAIKNNRTLDSGIFESVRNHILLNDPIDKSSRGMLNEVSMDLKAIREKDLPEFARKVIFQKALFELWAILCAKFVHKKQDISKVPAYINALICNGFRAESDVFNSKHMYLQDTVYNGQKIKVTQVAKRQTLRLIIAQAIVPKVIKLLRTKHGISDSELEILSTLAKTEIGSYLQQMVNDKKKTFEKSYKTNFSLDVFLREELFAAEQKRREEISEENLTTEFDKLVEKHIAHDLKSSYSDLQETIGFSYEDINYSLEYELEDEF